MILQSRQHWDEQTAHLCWSMPYRHRLYLILFFVIISLFISPNHIYSSSFSFSSDDCPTNTTAGTFTVPRLYFDLEGSVAGQSTFLLQIQGTQPTTSIDNFSYRYFIVDRDFEVIATVEASNAENGTMTEVDFIDVDEDNYMVYGIIYESVSNYTFPTVGSSITNLLNDIDNCELCGAYSLGAIQTDICVPEMTGNTPTLDGIVEPIYASIGRYSFATPLGYEVNQTTSDERDEEGANIFRIDNSDVALEGERTGDIQDFYVTYDADYVYLSVVGVNGFTVEPDRALTDQLDLFIAIDTDNDVGNSLSSNVAPLNKGVDFNNWLPDYFVVIERVEEGNDLAELYHIENGGSVVVQSDMNRLTLTPNVPSSFEFGYVDKVVEVRIPWDDIGSAPDPSTGATWNFAVYTTYDDETYDAFDVAPQTNRFENLPDRPEDIDYCDTSDPVTSNPDDNCMDCPNPDGLGIGDSDCSNGASPGSDGSANDFDTIEEYFQIQNMGQLTEVCCQDPLIVNPPDDSRLCLGSPISFVVVVTANVPSYQWQVKAPTADDFMDLVDEGLYSGTNTSVLDISDNTFLEGYEYQVVITEMGGCSVTSEVVVVNVNPIPEIITQPMERGSCEGEMVTFSAEATGNNLAYRWELSENDGIDWEEVPVAEPYSGVLSNTLSLVNSNDLNGNLYRLRIIEDNDLDPDCTVYTDAVALRVGGEAIITEQPADVQPCEGEDIIFRVTATGENLSYRWELSSDQGMTWVNVPEGEIYLGTKLNRLLITDITGLENYQYRVVITSTVDAVDCPTISDPAILFEPIVAVTGCNNDINISLGPSCEVLITPDVILEGEGAYEFFSVVLTDLNDNEIPNPLTSEYLCETIKATVIDDCTGSSCWSLINVENRSTPRIIAPLDLRDEIGCEDVNLARNYPRAVLNRSNTLVIQQNCEIINTSIEYSEIIEDGCPEFIVEVTWTITDKCGNTGSDIQRIFFRRPPVVIPSGEIDFRCGQYNGTEDACRPFLDYNENGFYNPGIDKYLNEEDGFCQYGAVKQKDEFELCANGVKKIIRWQVYDWCRPDRDVKAHPVLGLQDNPSFCVIKSEDRGDPIFACPSLNAVGGENNPREFSTNETNCSGTATLTFNATDRCNAAIEYRLLNIYRRTKLTRPFEYELVSPVEYTISGSNPRSSPTFTITGLECDIYYAEVQAKDECNHITGKLDEETEAPLVLDQPNCLQYFEIVDDVFPVAVCDDDKSISFTVNCRSTVPADVFDGGSIDNCFLAENAFTVARASADSNNDGLPEPNDFQPTITFTGSDLVASQCSTDGIELILRVEDAKGNFGYCSVNVELEDRIKPTCIGNSTTRPCTELAFLFDEETTTAQVDSVLDLRLGPARGSDNCGEEVRVVDKTLSIVETKCGAGTIRRRYRVEDVCGNRSEFCTQTLTVSAVSNWTMNFPIDAVVECETEGDVPRAEEIEDILTNNGCDEWALFVEDDLFEREEDACYKIIREYRLINWCNYTNTTEPYEVPRPSNLILTGNGITLRHTNNQQNNALIVYRQIIKVTQSTVPDIAVVHNTNCDDDDDCEEEQLFTIFPINPCSPIDNIGYYFVEDTDMDGVPETSYENEADPDPYGSVTDEIANPKVAGRYPYGTHKMVFFIEDVCGGRAVEEVEFTIEDCATPTASCVLGLEVELMISGSSILRASQFNATSSDACSNPVTFSFSDNPADSLREYTCNDIDRNIPIDLYVFDAAGNIDVCSTVLLIKPNEQSGCSNGNGNSTVAGAIRTEIGGDLDNVSISLNGSSEASLTTSVEGLFTFQNVPAGGDYTITPNKDENHTNGVSTFDLVLIRKHILNLTPFDSPYKIIAADANDSGSVTTFDLVILRRLILGVESILPATTSWRFVDKDYVFPDPTNPWLEVFPEAININNLPEGVLEARFVALKVGDVNYSATPNDLQNIEERDFTHTLYLDVNDYTYQKGEIFRVDLNSIQLNEIAGCQFTLSFDPHKISFLNLVEGVSQAEHWNVEESAMGWLKMSWDGNTNAPTLASLNFQAQQEGKLSEVLTISQDNLVAEAYATANTEPWNIDLNYHTTSMQQERLQLLQNVPNPFQKSTTIRFFLPETSPVNLEIRNISGQVIYQYEETLDSGYQEIFLEDIDILDSGVLYYQLTTNTEQAMRKMIKVN